MVTRRAFQQAAEEQEIAWPSGWPVPRAGEHIRVGGLVGFIEYVGWEPSAGVLRVFIR